MKKRVIRLLTTGLISISIVTVGCAQKKIHAAQFCEYTTEAKSQQANFLSNHKWANCINAHSVRVKNQIWESDSYQYCLTESFLDDINGMCACTIEIHGKGGADLSDDEIEDLRNMLAEEQTGLHADYVSIEMAEYSSTPLEQNVTYDKKGVVLHTVCTFPLINGDTKSVAIKQKTNYELKIEENKGSQSLTGILALPEPTAKQGRVLTLKNSNSNQTVRVSAYGCQIIWDTTEAEGKIKAKVEQGANPESLDLELGQEIKLVDKKGNQHNLCKGDFIYTTEEEERAYPNHLSCYQAFFSEPISLDEVESIIIDGETYSRE